MRLWILSDLHLRNMGEKFRAPNADACVVAGDVCEGVGEALRWLSVNIGARMPVLFVPGNHEHYGDSLTAGLYTARQMLERGEAPGVHLLDNEAVVIGDVRFVGATLWTDYRLNATSGDRDVRHREVMWAQTAAGRGLMDHSCIRVGDGSVRRAWAPSDAAREHHKSVTYLAGELALPHDGPTVVVTHHAPHPGAISPQFAGSYLNPAFVSDMTDFILAHRPELWVFGHVHSSHDYCVGDTRLLCNPRGYVNRDVVENNAFDRRLVVEVSKRKAAGPTLDPEWVEDNSEQIEAAVRKAFGLTTFDVLGHAPVLWTSWECDHTAVLVELGNGMREFVTLGETSMGGPVDLREKVHEYRRTANATEALLALRAESRKVRS